MKVAFASSDGVTVDRHFGLSEAYYLWELDRENALCVGKIENSDVGDLEDKTLARAQALEGCTLVYSMQIGGPAAAKLVARHIQPLKTGTEQPIEVLVAKLQSALHGQPPPWLSKALGMPVKRAITITTADD
jgi:nitrogen fixation protein NifX